MPQKPGPKSRVQRTPLGARIKELRGDLTLRQFAESLGLDFTYLSKVENGFDIPGEETLRNIAIRFGADPDELLALAGKVPAELTQRARREVPMGRLLRRLPNLSADQLQRIYEVAEIDKADRGDER